MLECKDTGTPSLAGAKLRLRSQLQIAVFFLTGLVVAHCWEYPDKSVADRHFPWANLIDEVPPERPWLANASIEALWPTPVYLDRWQNQESYVLNFDLLTLIAEIQQKRAGRKAYDTGWQSGDLLKLAENNVLLKALVEHILAVGKTYVIQGVRGAQPDVPGPETVNFKLTIDTLWANVNSVGHINKMYVGNTDCLRRIAGIYYVSFPEDVDAGDYESNFRMAKAGNLLGDLLLDDPRLQAFNSVVPPFTNWYGVAAQTRIQGRRGLTVLWPGWLHHFVEPHHGEARTSRVFFYFSLCVTFEIA